MRDYLQKNSSEVLKVLGSNIRIVRTNKKLDLQQLSKLADYDRGCLSRLENGEGNPNYLTIIKVAKTLGVWFPSLFSRNFDYQQTCVEINWLRDDDFLFVFIENYNKRLKQLQREQKQVFIDTEISEAAISRFLNKKNNNPRLKTLELLAKAVDMDLEILFTR